MKLRLQLVIESDTGEVVTTQDVAQLQRHSFRAEEVGLTLAEAKQLLGSVQRVMVQEQLSEYIAEQTHCRECGQMLARKGQHEIVFRTLFGELRLCSPRLYWCSCRHMGRASFSPLAKQLPERTAPELVYLETKFAALLSYGLTVDILSEILPIGDPLNTRSVRRQLAHSAERMEKELGEERWAFIDGCQLDWNRLPRPDPPLIVGLDGGFVHAKDQPSRSEGWFEVIVGKSMPSDGESKCLAFVQTYDQKQKRRLFELLRSQHMQMNQQITFLTDGGEDIRELPQFINPEAEHILDWFHIATSANTCTQRRFEENVLQLVSRLAAKPRDGNPCSLAPGLPRPPDQKGFPFRAQTLGGGQTAVAGLAYDGAFGFAGGDGSGRTRRAKFRSPPQRTTRRLRPRRNADPSSLPFLVNPSVMLVSE